MTGVIKILHAGSETLQARNQYRKPLFLGVMFSVGIPWVIYFAATGGLESFFHYYFYQNIFGYSYLADPVLPNMIIAIVRSVGAFFYRNPQISLLIVLGIIWLLTRKRKEVKTVEKINLVLLFGVFACGVYKGGQGYRYYGLVLTPFMALGLVPVARLLEGKFEKTSKSHGLSAYSLAH